MIIILTEFCKTSNILTRSKLFRYYILNLIILLDTEIKESISHFLTKMKTFIPLKIIYIRILSVNRCPSIVFTEHIVMPREQPDVQRNSKVVSLTHLLATCRALYTLSASILFQTVNGGLLYSATPTHKDSYGKVSFVKIIFTELDKLPLIEIEV